MAVTAASSCVVVELLMNTTLGVYQATNNAKLASIRATHTGPPPLDGSRVAQLRATELNDAKLASNKEVTIAMTSLLIGLCTVGEGLPVWLTGPWLEKHTSALFFSAHDYRLRRDTRCTMVGFLTDVYLRRRTTETAQRCRDVLFYWSAASIKAYQRQRTTRRLPYPEANTLMGLFGCLGGPLQPPWPCWLTPSALMKEIAASLARFELVRDKRQVTLYWRRGTRPTTEARSSAKVVRQQFCLVCEAFSKAADTLLSVYMQEMNKVPCTVRKSDTRIRHIALHKALDRLFPEGTARPLLAEQTVAVVAEFNRVAAANRVGEDDVRAQQAVATASVAYTQARHAFDGWVAAMGYVVVTMRHTGASLCESATHSVGGRETLMYAPVTLLKCLQTLERVGDPAMPGHYDLGPIDRLAVWCRRNLEGEGVLADVAGAERQRVSVFGDSRNGGPCTSYYSALHSGDAKLLSYLFRLAHPIDLTDEVIASTAAYPSQAMGKLFGKSAAARLVSPVVRAGMTQTAKGRVWMRSIIPKKPRRTHDSALVDAWRAAANGPRLPLQ